MGNDDLRAGSVSLGQYAGVIAGVAASFPLLAVLANEGVDPRAWPRAEEAWARRLAGESEQDRAIQEQLDERLREARQRYGSRVSPLEDDLRAWLDFSRRWSASPDPLALLGQIGLRSTDVLRLHQAWSERLTADPALERQAQEILGQGPGELPTITITARVMIPPALPPEPAPVEEAEKEQDDDGGAILVAAAEAPPLFVAFPGWPIEQDAPPAAPALPLQEAPATPVVLSQDAPVKPARGSATLEMTPLSPFAPEPVLPFHAAEPVEPSPALPRKKPAQTVEFVLTAPGPALPFSAGPAPDTEAPALTLDQHAALHAELAVAPDDAASVLARYRLTPESQARIDEHWRNLLAATPAVRTVWMETYQAYCVAFTKKNQGSP